MILKINLNLDIIFSKFWSLVLLEVPSSKQLYTFGSHFYGIIIISCVKPHIEFPSSDALVSTFSYSLLSFIFAQLVLYSFYIIINNNKIFVQEYILYRPCLLYTSRCV